VDRNVGLGAGLEQETSDQELAYERFPRSERTAYREGWLPDQR